MTVLFSLQLPLAHGERKCNRSYKVKVRCVYENVAYIKISFLGHVTHNFLGGNTDISNAAGKARV